MQAVFLLKSLLLSTSVSFSVASILAVATGVPGTAVARGVAVQSGRKCCVVTSSGRLFGSPDA